MFQKSWYCFYKTSHAWDSNYKTTDLKHYPRFIDGRKALNQCWSWVEDNSISGDDLYELIDNAECTGVSEFAEEEKNLNIGLLWSLLVDAVAYTSWRVYKKENAKYLPQALESIKEDSIITFIDSAIKTSFITLSEIQNMKKYLLLNYQSGRDNAIVIKRNDFMEKLRIRKLV